MCHFGITVDQSQLIDAQRATNQLVLQMKQLQRIAGFALAALGLDVFTDSLDKAALTENRLKSITNSLDELKVAQEGVANVARETLSPVEDVAALYQRYTQVTDGLGKSQQDVLAFTESLIKAGKLSGASTSELQGALVQLGQGIGNNFKSGGQELNSILEQTPMIAKIIADSLGIKKGDLKEAAKAGKITAEVVFGAFEKRAAELDQKFGDRNKTFEEVRTALGIEWGELMKQVLPAMKLVVEWLLKGVKALREWVDRGEAMNSMIAAMIVVVGALTVAFGGLALEVLAAVAPFIALFLILEDIVTFMRGGESIFGDFFGGPEEQKLARAVIQAIWDDLKKFVAWISDPEQMGQTFRSLYDSAVEWGGKAIEWLRTKMTELAAYIGEQFSTALFGKKGTALRDFVDKQRELEGDTDAERTGMAEDARRNWGANLDAQAADFAGSIPGTAWDTITGIVDLHRDYAATMAAAGDRVAEFFGTKPFAEEPAAVRFAPQQGPITITNEVTVQGNATPAVAREIAQRTGSSTTQALGRDRAAIGAAAGIPQ